MSRELNFTFDDGAGAAAGRSVGSFALSFLLQGTIAVVLIVIPILSYSLPTPEGIMTFMAQAPPPPPPPPPPPKQVRRAAPKPVLNTTPQFVAPVDIPDDIGAGSGVDFGVPGGVEGGVPGGLIGGIVGGLPSGPPPPPPKAAPVRVGGEIRAPTRTIYVDPVYPEIAKQARVSGVVILEAIIDPNGNVTNITVLRSIPLLDQSAMDAVRQWKYQPTLLNGVPVPIVMTVTVQFNLG